LAAVTRAVFVQPTGAGICAIGKVESLPVEEMMIIDVGGRSEQTKLNFISTGPARRESSSFNPSHLMLLRVILVVDKVIDTRLWNDAAYSMVHLSRLLFTASNTHCSLHRLSKILRVA
jgi:hypothetical protein